MKANHLDVVQLCHQIEPPISGSLQSCFAFQQRVLTHLSIQFPAERWGYLAKGGENTLPYRGETIKVGRVCGPDAQLYKILTDIPTTNDPIWNDDGNVATDFNTTPDVFYRAFDGAATPAPGPTPVPIPTPPTTPGGPDVADLAQHVADLVTVMKTFNLSIGRIAEAAQTNEQMQKLRHADLVAHFDEQKRILAALTFEGEVQIRYLGTAKITLRPVKP